MKIYFSVHAGDSLSHVLRTLGVAKELQARGHMVSYGSSAWTKSFVAKEGVPYCCTNQVVGHSDFAKKKSALFLEELVVQVETERKIIEEINPQLVVADPGLSASFLGGSFHLVRVLHGMYLHLVSSHSAYSSQRRRETVSYLEEIAHEVEDRLGLPKTFAYDDLFTTPVVVPGVREFEISSPDFPAHFIGPMVHYLPIHRIEKGVCYLTLGTGNRDDRLLQRIVSLTKDLFKKTYIATGYHFQTQLDTTGHEAEVKAFFHHIPEDVDLVICHGGHGTVYQALLGNKRLLVIPLNLDQLCQAYNVMRTGAGEALIGRSEGLLVKPELTELRNIVSRLQQRTYRKISIPQVNDYTTFASTVEKAYYEI
ncbi:hypothetical protein HYW21_05815 [Candidatus Woesearchaeota archaeon]|nr:hypothetical protein [Candidatus Woesearchaeota archaeon]